MQLAVLGDSITYQWLAALMAAAGINPHLDGIRFVKGESPWASIWPFSMAIVPPTVNGSLVLLRAIDWSWAAGGHKVVLAGAGTHYNLASTCAYYDNNTRVLLICPGSPSHRASKRRARPLVRKRRVRPLVRQESTAF